jgi:LEA14-like dessication related protein
MKKLTFALFLLATTVLSGCASLVPQLETPHLSIVSLELVKADILSQELNVRMRVQNPNDRALPVKGLDYRLEVEGQKFATGVLGAPFTVPSFGEAEFDMRITANLASTIVRLLSRSDQHDEAINYRMVGKLSLSEGLLRNIPFEETGTFTLN